MPGRRDCEMQLVPWYLLDRIVGYEGEGEEESDESEEGEETDEGESEGQEGESGKPPTQEDINNLKTALRSERQQRREAQRQLKAATRQQSKKKEEDDASNQEAEALRQQVAESDARTAKLAQTLVTTAIDNAIVKAATSQKFRDVDDALTGINRSEIDWEQDEDDPSNVKVDADTVKDAVAALAKTKPYLLQTAAEDDASGSSFGGGKKKNNQGLTDDVLRERYPALRRGAPN
jgi:hypothetical protein